MSFTQCCPFKAIISVIIVCTYSVLLAKDLDVKPNILYINADDLGVMDVGYNNPLFLTPNIDRLATEGMIFSQTYAPAANCAPSRACVHSGQWGARHGVYTVGTSERGENHFRKLIPIKNTKHLSPEVYTMAEALRDGGYRTIHLGKYHIGKNPLNDGFEVNIGGDSSGSPAGGYFSPWKKGSMKEWSDKVPAKTHRIDVYVNEAIKFIKNHKDEPMFIHFSPYLVHTPLQGVPEYMSNYIGTDLNIDYASMVEKLDWAIGEVITALDKEGLGANTLIVFCSDNGGIRAVNSQAPYRAGKGSYYEGGVLVPLVMRWPNKIKAGTETNVPVSSIDFYPTFVEVAGLKEQGALDGVSLLPLMLGEESWNAPTYFWHFPVYLQAYNPSKDDARDPLFRTRPGTALRSGKWKLHEYFEDGAIELYDLESDQAERIDLSEQLPEKTAELHYMMVEWRNSIDADIPFKPNPKYDPKLEAAAIKKHSKP